MILWVCAGIVAVLAWRAVAKARGLSWNLTKITTLIETANASVQHIRSYKGEHAAFAEETRIELELQLRLARLRAYPRHEVTRELVKNGIVANSMGRLARIDAMERLWRMLVAEGIALDRDDFLRSYAS